MKRQPHSHFLPPRRRMQLTPRKMKLHKGLDFLSASNSRILNQNKVLKKKLKTPKRGFNQAIQRKMSIIRKKDAEIKLLKEKLRGEPLAIELTQTKLDLERMKDSHSKLKKIS